MVMAQPNETCEYLHVFLPCTNWFQFSFNVGICAKLQFPFNIGVCAKLQFPFNIGVYVKREPMLLYSYSGTHEGHLTTLRIQERTHDVHFVFLQLPDVLTMSHGTNASLVCLCAFLTVNPSSVVIRCLSHFWDKKKAYLPYCIISTSAFVSVP